MKNPLQNTPVVRLAMVALAFIVPIAVAQSQNAVSAAGENCLKVNAKTAKSPTPADNPSTSPVATPPTTRDACCCPSDAFRQAKRCPLPAPWENSSESAGAFRRLFPPASPEPTTPACPTRKTRTPSPPARGASRQSPKPPQWRPQRRQPRRPLRRRRPQRRRPSRRWRRPKQKRPKRRS